MFHENFAGQSDPGDIPAQSDNLHFGFERLSFAGIEVEYLERIHLVVEWAGIRLTISRYDRARLIYLLRFVLRRLQLQDSRTGPDTRGVDGLQVSERFQHIGRKYGADALRLLIALLRRGALNIDVI